MKKPIIYFHREIAWHQMCTKSIVFEERRRLVDATLFITGVSDFASILEYNDLRRTCWEYDGEYCISHHKLYYYHR
jgi:hypothetical protein